jgi:hypothetical protein
MAQLQHYRVKYDPSLHSTQVSDDPAKKEQFEYAEKHFSPLYFIRSYPDDKRKVEMSFDLTCYQPQASCPVLELSKMQLTCALVRRSLTVWSTLK